MNTIKQKPYLVQERYIYFQDLRMTFCKESIPCKNKFRAVTNRFCLGDLQVNLRVAETRTSCCMYSEASVSMSWMKHFFLFVCFFVRRFVCMCGFFVHAQLCWLENGGKWMWLRKGLGGGVGYTHVLPIGQWKKPRGSPRILCKSAFPNLFNFILKCSFSFSPPLFLLLSHFLALNSLHLYILLFVSCLLNIIKKIVNSNFFLICEVFVLNKLIFHSASFFLSFRIYVKPLIQSYPNPFKNDLKCKLGILWRLKVYWHFWSTFVWTKTSIVKSVKYIFFYCLFKWT